jgi:DNA-directed RNA polymerase subunit M/transcription elongation factor TFIIS
MQQQSPKLNVSLNKTVAFECDECQNQVFIQGVLLRKASKFLTGTTQDAVVPIPIFACSKCGHVNQEFIPEQLRTMEEKGQ